MEFTESGYIILPQNILDTPAQPGSRQFRGISQIKHDLENFWIEIVTLAQTQSDLHSDPLRRSDHQPDQEEYQKKLKPWITSESKSQIESLLARLEGYFTTDGTYAKQFAVRYPKVLDPPREDCCLEVVYVQYEILWGFCVGFAEMRVGDVLLSLQPQGKGAKKFVVVS